MFWIRYQAWVDGALVEREAALRPAPTEVEYPKARVYTARTTQDGAVVIQRPQRDGRPRRWVWSGYGPRHAPYSALWAVLEGMEYRTRLAQNLPGTVEIWEDVSGAGGFDRTDANGNRVYTTVKFLQVNRTPRQGGGPVSYESVVEFVIADTDTDYRAF